MRRGAAPRLRIAAGDSLDPTESQSRRVEALEAEIERLRAELDAARAEAPLLRTLLHDIAERQKVEARLRETQEWMHLAQSAGRVGAYSYDFVSGALVWSPSTYALYGFDPDEEPNFESWLTAVHPDDRDRVGGAIAATLERGADFDMVYRLLRPDGGERWVHDRGRVSLDESGRPLRLAGLNIDVTEPRAREAALQDSEARFRALAEASAAVTWRMDAAGSLLGGCPSWAAFTGQSEAEVADGGWAAALHPDDREDVEAAWERSLRALAPYTSEFRVRCADGQYRTLHARATPLLDETGAVREWIGAAFDITDQRRTVTELQDREAQLRASEERLRLAQEAGGVGAFEWFPDTNLLVGSEQYFRLWGLPQTGVIGGDDLVAMLHPADRPLAGPSRMGALESALDYAEYRIVRADTGEQRWLARRGRMIEDGAGPARMFGVIYDITERKQAENRLNAVLESITDGFVGLDAAWRITLFNGAAERHFGLPREAVLGRAIWEALPIDPQGTVGGALRQVMESRKPLSVETESVGRPGRAIELRIAPKLEGGLATSFSDVTARREAERHRELLVNELNHRVKNTLAIVQAMANQTLRRGGVAPEITEAFEGRLGALARAHDILTRRNWDDAYVQELIVTALAPFSQAAGERITVDGPALRVPARTAVSFSLALHELATNASKYGALSNDAGRVAVRWRIARVDDAAWLKLSWREEGGPPVVQPPRRGFGSRMIEQALATELRGQVRIEFGRKGVSCTVQAPLPYLDDAGRRDRGRSPGR